MSEDAGNDTTNAEGATTIAIKPLSEFPEEASFHKRQIYPALIAPVKQVASLRKKLKNLALKLPRIKNVYPAESETERILVLANEDARNDPISAKQRGESREREREQAFFKLKMVKE